jgi:4-amino-4-deoxy-L-arabinose transferase-like glycosyltransferase
MSAILSHAQSEFSRTNWHYTLLALILLLALGIRLWGIDFDLPNLYHPDEDALIMPALSILKTGDFEPTRLEYGSFQIYLLTGVFTAAYLLLARDGRIGDPNNLPIYERGSYPMLYGFPEFYLVARMVSAFAGVGTVLLTYLLVRRLSNPRVALLAAALASVTPMLVDNAHYSTPDSFFTLMVMLSLYLLVRAYDNWQSDSLWSFLGAAFVCGLATSTKYNGAVLLAPLFLVPVLRVRNIDDWISVRVLGAPISFLLGFFIGTPYALINIPLFLNWSGYTLHLYNQPGVVPLVPTWRWHLEYLTTSREAIVFIAGTIGFLLSLRLWGRRGLLIIIFVLVFGLAIVAQTNREARMWMPLAPIFAAWTALLIDVIDNRLSKLWLFAEPTQEMDNRLRKFIEKNLLAILTAFVLIPAFFLSARASNSLNNPDVRTATATWIESNIPKGTPIAVDYFSPNIDPDVWPVTRSFRHFDHELDWYQEQGIQYLIYSQGIYQEGRLTATQLSEHQQLLNELCSAETILGPFLSNPDFSMSVFKVPPCS